MLRCVVRLAPLARHVVRRGRVGRALAPMAQMQQPLRVLGGMHSVRCFSSEHLMNLPSLGAESITEGTVIEWLKKEGDAVNKGDVVCCIETDKVTVEVEAEVSGIVAKHFAAVDDTVEVGKPLLTITPGDGAGAAAAAPAQKVETPAAAAPVNDGKASLAKGFADSAAARAAPAAPATPAAAPATPAAAPKAAPAAVAAPVEPKLAGSRVETREKMSRMRMRIAARLKEAQNTTAMLTTFNEVDMTNAMAMRKEYKDAFEKTHGVKLGFMSIFGKAVAAALQEFPAVNAVIDDATNEIVYRDFVDISCAVSSPRGLVVPVLRNVESMTFSDFEQSLNDFAKKARDNTLTLDEMTGGTFTISNGGVFGSLMGTPIINPPQSAILGMHATKMRPIVMADGSIQARPMMYIALTYDHRIIDGREAVQFLVSVKNKVEDPRRMLLEL